MQCNYFEGKSLEAVMYPSSHDGNKCYGRSVFRREKENVYSKRESIKDDNHLSLGSISQEPGRVKQGVLLWVCLFSSLPGSWNISTWISLAGGFLRPIFPTVCVSMFQDANVKLIRELREEIDRLKTMLMSFELVCSNISLQELLCYFR